MNLRKLHLKDAPLMLEWMHDSAVIENLQTNFFSNTIEDCNRFIGQAQDTSHNMHMAIVDENDIYMGTVSLKHIKEQKAEFAIAMRRCAMGKGYSTYGMAEIVKIGFEILGLEEIYWCVARENERAVKFYDKNGYKNAKVNSSEVETEQYTEEDINRYIWYRVSNY